MNHPQENVAGERENADWLTCYIETAISKKFCTNLYCTTCGATDFRKGLLRAASRASKAGLETHLNIEIAHTIAKALSGISAQHELEWVSAVRLIIVDLKEALGLRELGETLGNSWAGGMLADMSAHYEKSMERRREHERQQDPAFIQKNREEKRLKRQAQHEARIKKYKELGRIWMAAHKDGSSTA